MPKRTAAGGQDHSGDFIPSARLQTLEDGGVFAIDRQQRDVVLLRQRRDERSTDDESLLVGEREILARFERFDRSKQSRGADHRGHHDVDLGIGDQCLDPGVAPFQAAGERIVRFKDFTTKGNVGDDQSLRVELPRLVEQQRPTGMGGESDDLEALGAARTTSSVCTPIDPVAPRIASRFLFTG